MRGRVGGRRAGLLEPQPQPAQRRAQLVRGVRDELPLAGDEPLEPCGHVVERAREPALLRAALDGRARRQVAARDTAGRLVEAPYRAGDLRRDHRSGREAEDEHEQPDGDQPDRGPPRGAPDRVDALRHPHGADRVGAARLQHRHRGGEDRLVERLAAALLLVRLAPERGHDLRPRAVVHAQPLLARRVGQQATLRADHDHASADGSGRTLGDLVERVASREVAGHQRRQRLGLAQRLRLDLGVDAIAQADDERHLERDDRQHEHVRQRQQEAGAEAYVSSSGAVNRKPTPRTVCR